MAQRRDLERQHGEPVVEIRPEASRLCFHVERAVRGGHDAGSYGPHLVGADGLHLLVLQDAQELRLHGRRRLADLVEEDRPVAGLLEEATAVAVGAGERAAHVAEELALEQRLRDGGAVLDEQGSVPPRTAAVDGARDQLLARAGLALDQHRDRTPRRPVDEREQRPQARRGPDEKVLVGGAARDRRQLGAAGIHAREHRAPERLAHEHGQLLDVARMLGHVVGGPELHGRDGELLRARPGGHDDRHLAAHRPQRADDVRVLGVGEPEIGHHAADRGISERLERAAQAVDGGHADAGLHAEQRLAHARRMVRVVLHHEHVQLRQVRAIHHAIPPLSPGRGQGPP